MYKLSVEEHFWGRYISDFSLDWASQSSAADTAAELQLAANGIYAIQCTEDGFFRLGATGLTAANLRANGRFVRAGDIQLIWVTQSDRFLAYVARDSIAAKWQYYKLGSRSPTL